jgi:hypothetical protein
MYSLQKFDIFVWSFTNRYPGGPLLNPLGLAKDIKNAHDWKLKEIKNGLVWFLFSYNQINYRFIISVASLFLCCRTSCNGSHAGHLCASLCDACRTN